MQQSLSPIHAKMSLKSLMSIPSARRHFYFYALLLLGANLLTGAWRSSQQMENQAAEEIVRIQRVAPDDVQLASNR